jgi:hypothetical protein
MDRVTNRSLGIFGPAGCGLRLSAANMQPVRSFKRVDLSAAESRPETIAGSPHFVRDCAAPFKGREYVDGSVRLGRPPSVVSYGAVEDLNARVPAALRSGCYVVGPALHASVF